MTVITHTQRKSRLAEMLDRPGGVSIGVALAQARANLDGLQDQARAIIGDNIAVLLAKPDPNLIEPMRLDLAYSASSQIIDAASPFSMDDLCTAAKGLCDLLDAAPRQGGFDWRIATVHAQAMKLLLALPPQEQAARTAILTNLHEVLRKKLPAADQSAI
ncbi:chemotaxis protein CheE [Brevundimonas vesicularis]|uniref:chemotaxis protein CheE n=1 Tax=Brevundimonas vesicularis TaxID=41276 RepID=UPI0022EC9705|nr:chemotaxis protein CheE [Brevundimonas vesicularis]WBT04668.1 chemotaxis protein CheE [Brevundimonas vesicularis]